MGSSASLGNDTSRITPRVTSSAVRRVGEHNELVTPAKNSDTASSTVASVYWSPTWPAWSPACWNLPRPDSVRYGCNRVEIGPVFEQVLRGLAGLDLRLPLVEVAQTLAHQ